MIEAVLSNPDHPEYGVATIPFPIPRDQYDHCVALLEALKIGDVFAADCRVDVIHNAMAFEEAARKQRFQEAEKDAKKRKREIAQAEKRIAELDRIFKRIYEDDISGAISHERFLKLSADYEAEQKELTEQVKAWRDAVETFEQDQAAFVSGACANI